MFLHNKFLVFSLLQTKWMFLRCSKPLQTLTMKLKSMYAVILQLSWLLMETLMIAR